MSKESRLSDALRPCRTHSATETFLETKVEESRSAEQQNALCALQCPVTFAGSNKGGQACGTVAGSAGPIWNGATARGEPDWGADHFHRYLEWRGRKTSQAPLWQDIELDRKADGRVERQRK